MPSSTETYLCDRFTAQELSFYSGVEDEKASVSPSNLTTPSLKTHLCYTHTYPQAESHENAAPCGGSRIQFSDLSLDDQIYAAIQLPPLTPRLRRGHREGWQRGGLKQERATEGGRRSAFSPQSHEFLWSGQMLPHIFLQHWQVAYCFPW